MNEGTAKALRTLVASWIIGMGLATACQAAPGARPVFPEWTHAMADIRSLQVLRHRKPVADLGALVKAANDEVNAVDFVPDDLVYGKQDYWATEAEFRDFGGMCRDYAVEKYRLLRRAGVPDADMEVYVGYIQHGRYTGELHAVLLIDDGRQSFVLDNINKEVLPAAALESLQHTYSIDRISWRVQQN